jgi:predicted DNA-binding transcriptional regulator AlpA
MMLLPNKIQAEDIAQDLGYSVRHVKERITKEPNFPAPIKVGRKRFWMRDEYKTWLMKQRER